MDAATRHSHAALHTTGPDGKPTTMWTDPGFNSSPLADHWMDKHLAQKAVNALGDETGFAMVQKTVLSPTRIKAWEGFVANTLDFARTQGHTMTVGILPYWLARKAVIEEPVLYVPDRLIVGKKSQRHAQSEDSLTHAGWSGLPQLIQHVDQWYIDTYSKNIVAVKRQSDQVVKIVIAPNGQIDTIYKAISDDIEGSVRGGQLKAIQQ